MRTSSITTRDWTPLRLLRLAVLAVGPIATLALLARWGGYRQYETPGVQFVATLLWSPLFLSVPALLMQNERDLTLPAVRPWYWRGLRLIPHLATSRDSVVRPETWVSTLSWLLMLTVTWSSCVEVVSRFL
jgi:hypothetical protein